MINARENPASLGQSLFIAEGPYRWRNTMKASGLWPLLTPPLLKRRAWQELTFWCSRTPSCCIGCPGPWGKGLRYGCFQLWQLLWDGEAQEICNHRSAASCNEMKGMFNEINIFQHYTCKSGERQHAYYCIAYLFVYIMLHVGDQMSVIYAMLITGLQTMLSGCEPNSGAVICFALLLWFSLLLKDFFFFVSTVLQGEMQDAVVELW